jgi:hypothetical protein
VLVPRLEMAEYIDPVKIKALEDAVGQLGREDAAKVFRAVDGLFKDLEADAINAKQAASYPGFNPQLQRVATDATFAVAEMIWNAREYLQKRADEYSNSTPAKR